MLKTPIRNQSMGTTISPPHSVRSQESDLNHYSPYLSDHRGIRTTSLPPRQHVLTSTQPPTDSQLHALESVESLIDKMGTIRPPKRSNQNQNQNQNSTLRSEINALRLQVSRLEDNVLMMNEDVMDLKSKLLKLLGSNSKQIEQLQREINGL
jgi:chromosome segregation ATPase